EILIELTMHLIGAAFENRVEHATPGVAELRRELVLQDGHFGGGLVRNSKIASAHVAPVVVYAFYLETVVTWTLPSHGRPFAQSDTSAGGDSGAQQRYIDRA